MITKTRKKRVLEIISYLEHDIQNGFFTDSCSGSIERFDQAIEGSCLSENLNEEVDLFEKRITKMINKFKKDFN